MRCGPAWLTLIGFVGCGGSEAPPELQAACEAADSVEVFVRSRVRDDRVEAGPRASCTDPYVARLRSALGEAVADAPELAGDGPYRLHVGAVADPPVRWIETHASGELLMGRDLPTPPASVFIHELAHRRWRAGRPSDAFGDRLLHAIEEGVADYVAAVAVGSPRIGPWPTDSEVRDLSSDEPSTSSGWEALALGTGFDPHHLGLDLARELYLETSRETEFAVDVLACGAEPIDFAGAVGIDRRIQEVLEACPARSRGRLRDAFRRWAPGPAEPMPHDPARLDLDESSTSRER